MIPLEGIFDQFMVHGPKRISKVKERTVKGLSLLSTKQ